MNFQNTISKFPSWVKFALLILVGVTIAVLSVQCTNAVQNWLKIENISNHAQSLEIERGIQDEELSRLKNIEYTARMKKEAWAEAEQKAFADVQFYAKNTIEPTLCVQAVAEGRLAVFNGEQGIQEKMIEQANKFCAPEDVPAFLKKKKVVQIETIYQEKVVFVDPMEWGSPLLDGLESQYQDYQ
jgi:hypothetical protein